MSNTPTVSVHEIEDLPLRSLFAREDREFTPWLAEPANLARLSRTLGFEMELTATEASTGSFRTDVLATRSQDGVAVVIENQFGRSDHDHFGKSLTYLAAHQASVQPTVRAGQRSWHTWQRGGPTRPNTDTPGPTEPPGQEARRPRCSSRRYAI